MYKLRFKNGLLYADIVLKHGDKEILVNDVIIDTGACQSIILTDFLSVNNIGFSDDDELVVLSGIGGAEDSAIRKKVDEIAMGDITLNDVFVDFGVIDPKDRINGLSLIVFFKDKERRLGNLVFSSSASMSHFESVTPLY